MIQTGEDDDSIALPGHIPFPISTCKEGVFNIFDMNIWGLALKLLKWKIDISAPRRDKCVICVAPHTSNWDFILGLCAYRSIGRKANFLMKDFWFFFPLGIIIRALGGIPVSRSSRGSSLTKSIVDDFKSLNYLNLAVTPEGTRSRTSQWKTGFLYIAYGADVPLQLGVINYAKKLITINTELELSGNIDDDMLKVKGYYSKFQNAALYHDRFSC